MCSRGVIVQYGVLLLKNQNALSIVPESVNQVRSITGSISGFVREVNTLWRILSNAFTQNTLSIILEIVNQVRLTPGSISGFVTMDIFLETCLIVFFNY